MDECHKKAKEILTENKDLVKTIADALLEYETITKEEIDSLVETGHMPEEESLADLKAKAKEMGIKGYTKMTKEELEEATK
jgi:cell division protease FtsH